MIENILLRYEKEQKSQNRQMTYFSPLCQLHLSISQKRAVQLVPCYVGVHHIIFLGPVRTWTSYNSTSSTPKWCMLFTALLLFRCLILKLLYSPWTWLYNMAVTKLCIFGNPHYAHRLNIMINLLVLERVGYDRLDPAM